MTALLALAIAIAAPAIPVRETPMPPARVKAGTPVLEARAALTEADVHRLLREWAAFEAALATLHDSVPELPHDGASPADLEKAEAAWAADARIRGALESTGTDPGAFLALYRRVADAWWALVEEEARAHTAAGLRRELAALRETKGEETGPVAAELERGLRALEESRALPPDVDAVRRHREELATIFSPEAAGP